MKVCVCGWYFKKPFLESIKDISYHVTIIANRDGLPDDYKGSFDYHVRENTGLEYGAYDYYLKNVWDGEDVLFLHDDMTLMPIIKNYEAVGPEVLFKTISEFDDDLVYIFKNNADKEFCKGIHGRAMFASGDFLQSLKDMNNGFPYDKNNTGHTFGKTPPGCKNYNWAVEELRKFWEVQQIGGCSVESVIIPAVNYHIRGRE